MKSPEDDGQPDAGAIPGPGAPPVRTLPDPDASFTRTVTDPDAYPPIRILGLRLRGVRRDYGLEFGDDNGPKPLSVIAGEISTGKTTVLEFIDYCLGNAGHPMHPEVLANVRAAQLAIEVLEHDGDPEDSEATAATAGLTRYVIERPVGGATKTVLLFRGDYNQLSASAPRRLSLDPADPDSLSYFLLRACGLAGLRVRQAPTQEESKTSILSFRDVMPLAFLNYMRIGSADLVLEHNAHRSLKLQQVIDFMFGVSDTELSAIAGQIEQLGKDLRETDTSLKTLRSFLLDAGLPSTDDIQNAFSQTIARRNRLAEELAEIDGRLTSSTEFVTQTRRTYQEAATRTRELGAQVRERETLLGRLATLHSQYADDLHKIELLDETQQLFDALTVSVCPACQNDLTEPVSVRDGHCSLCAHVIAVPDAAGAEESAANIDLEGERRSVQRRLRELCTFMDQISDEAGRLRADAVGAGRLLAGAQEDLDSATAGAIAPFITQRDQLVVGIAGADAELATLSGQLELHRLLTERSRDRDQLSSSLALAKERKRALEQSHLDRDNVVVLLSRRFEYLLRQFEYPKLDGVFIDRRFVPHVRGTRYNQVGSAGAMTLISLAWTLAIFELAVERGQSHPGFLMIDSPQKGLLPGRDAPADQGSDEIARVAHTMVERVYEHVRSWLSENGHRAQIILVDNAPPPSLPDEAIVVRYGGTTGPPPYGLIEDATD